jgi:hypothetical protein
MSEIGRITVSYLRDLADAERNVALRASHDVRLRGRPLDSRTPFVPTALPKEGIYISPARPESAETF